MAGALSGLKIVELGEMVSAPYAAKLMADMGAEVIKIERPGAGDRARGRGPFPGGTAHLEKSGLFLYLNTNKLGVTLDVSRPEGFELLERLAADADVLIHNVAPSDMDRIGLGFERLRARNPRLVMTSISPWGLSGPRREWRAEDLTLWSASGICYINGGGHEHPEMPPLKAFGQQSGFQGGVHAAVATMGAVFAQVRDGEGQHVDVSIYESLAAQMELFFEFWPYMNMVASRLGQKPIQPLEVMECRDGYIFVCCVEEHQWRNFVEMMGNPEWAAEEIFADRLMRAHQLGRAQGFSGGLAEAAGRARSLQEGAGAAYPLRAGLDHGRPAQFRSSEKTRFLRRDSASRGRHAQVSRRAAEVPVARRGRFATRRRRWGSITQEIFGARSD